MIRMPAQTSLGTFTDADLWTLKQALASAQPQQPPQSSVPQFVVPAPCIGRALLETETPWTATSGRFESPGRLNDNNVWLIGFTPSAFNIGQIATVEYQDPPTTRNYQLILNSDASVIAKSSAPVQTPGIQVCSGPPAPHTGRIQLQVGARYTFAIWNAATTSGGNKMAGELYLG
jgi:hypothetical protein